MNRRSAMKSTIGLIAAPALPGIGRKSTTKTNPIRKSFDDYVDAYRAFFSVRPSEVPNDDDSTPEAREFWLAMLGRCRGWYNARKSLVCMILEANGYELEGKAPMTIAAVMVDLGDVLLVVSDDSDHEGIDSKSWINCVNFCVVPRSPAMRTALESLPAWPDDEVCDNSWHSPSWYKILAKEPTDGDDD